MHLCLARTAALNVSTVPTEQANYSISSKLSLRRYYRRDQPGPRKPFRHSESTWFL